MPNMANRVEEMASKAAGAMKAAKAMATGLTGVFKQLAREHGEVTALLLRVKQSSDVQTRRELFPKIRKELLAHEKGELREVYPAFRQHTELQAMAESHEQEAGQLEALLNELNALPSEDPAWPQKFANLVELVEHHTKEEEDEYFPTASRILGKEETERLQAPYEKARTEGMAQAE
jgi:hypothetical protein